MSHVLVSFCNVRLERAPVLALLDVRTSELEVVDLPDVAKGSQGITGLALSDSFLFAAAPAADDASPASALCAFDRRDLSLAARHVFECGVDVHSLWLEGDRLWAVSTGTDELLELVLDGPEVRSESVAWRPEPDLPRADGCHLNAVARVRGELLVSAFGPRTGERLSSANDGFVVNVEDGRRLVSGIDQPHSFGTVAGEPVVCESRRMSVRWLEGEESLALSGYTRGLCTVDDSLLVGVSRGRLGSQGEAVAENPSDPGEIAGACSIVRCRPNALEVESVIDTAWLGQEIYDLLPVEGVGGWPLLERPAADRELLKELWNAYDAASARMIQALHLSADRKRRTQEARDAFAKERKKARSTAQELAVARAQAKQNRRETRRIAKELAALAQPPPARRQAPAGEGKAPGKGGPAAPAGEPEPAPRADHD